MNLEKHPVSRHLIEKLTEQNYFTAQNRLAALEILFPSQQHWSQWTHYLLLVLGSTLVLSGIIYFFAFNWFKLSTFEKFALIQLAILITLVGTFYFKLHSLIGQFFLLAASILIGVFLAVFGQIYQTGADSYQLFLAWSIFISAWVIISNFAVLWFIFLILLNLSLILYWQQGLFVSHELEFMLFLFLAILNGIFLILREVGYLKGLEWLKGRWLRIILVLGILVPLFIPMFMFILDFHKISYSISIGAIFGLIVHIIFFSYYRYKQPDLWVIATTILSICIILETLNIKIFIVKMVANPIITLFLLTVLTIGTFSLGIIILRSITKSMSEQHGN